jgi:hypothetical protein
MGHGFLGMISIHSFIKSVDMRDSLNNIKETWEQNEKELQNQEPARLEQELPATVPSDDFEQLVKKEADEYDHTDSEEKLLTGGRASMNDESGGVGNG